MADQVLRVLVVQGEEITDDIIEGADNKQRPKTHWKEIESWQTRARAYLSTNAPEFLDQAEMVSVNENVQHETYPKLRAALGVLKALQEGPAEARALRRTSKDSEMPNPASRRIFVVHGHSDVMKLEVARFLEKAGFQPIILHEQADSGDTVIEKFERHAADVGFAVILMSPDDLGSAKSDRRKAQPRARQNVVLELGYFVGRLGRARVCVLVSEKIELPSDYVGVVYKKYDLSGAWKLDLARELGNAGFPIDLKAVL